MASPLICFLSIDLPLNFVFSLHILSLVNLTHPRSLQMTLMSVTSYSPYCSADTQTWEVKVPPSHSTCSDFVFPNWFLSQIPDTHVATIYLTAHIRNFRLIPNSSSSPFPISNLVDSTTCMYLLFIITFSSCPLVIIECLLLSGTISSALYFTHNMSWKLHKHRVRIISLHIPQGRRLKHREAVWLAPCHKARKCEASTPI